MPSRTPLLALVLLAQACAIPQAHIESSGGELEITLPMPDGMLINPGPGHVPPPRVYNPYFFGEQAFLDLGMGASHMCALKLDGTILCYGTVERYLAAPPGVFEELEVSPTGSCARASDDSWTCWGFPAGNEHWLPGGPEWPAGPIHELHLGALGACDHRADGTVYCWGRDPWVAQPVGSYSQFDVNTMGLSGCGVRSDTQEIACAAYDGEPMREEYELTGTFSQVNLHMDVIAGVRTDGRLAAAGVNRLGLLQDLPADTDFIEIQVGDMGSVALRADGSLYLHDHDLEAQSWRYQAPEDWTYIQVVYGDTSYCARADSGRITCVGNLDWLPEPDPNAP